MFEKIKKLLKKEERIACIVWDGKTMSYPHLTKSQIEEIKNDPNRKDWIVTEKRADH